MKALSLPGLVCVFVRRALHDCLPACNNFMSTPSSMLLPLWDAMMRLRRSLATLPEVVTEGVKREERRERKDI